MMMTSEPSPEHIAIAKYVGKVFGGDWKVTEFDHDTAPLAIDILSSANRPKKRTTSYSTIGLSDHPMPFKDGEFPTRIELAGACGAQHAAFPNVLAAAAFCIMRSDKIYHPGTVMPDYVREYFKGTELPHLYLTAPFLWDVGPLVLGKRRVSWLLAMPISEAEFRYLRKHGDQKLEDLLEKHSVDIFDLARPSVV